MYVKGFRWFCQHKKRQNFYFFKRVRSYLVELSRENIFISSAPKSSLLANTAFVNSDILKVELAGGLLNSQKMCFDYKSESIVILILLSESFHFHTVANQNPHAHSHLCTLIIGS